jgi:hypothetical protein
MLGQERAHCNDCCRRTNPSTRTGNIASIDVYGDALVQYSQTCQVSLRSIAVLMA